MSSFFGKQKVKTFNSLRHGSIRLTKKAWQHATDRHGSLVELNSHLVEQTLEDPDEIRQSQHPRDTDTFVYYKSPASIYRVAQVTVPAQGLQFAVCIDAQQGNVRTIYLVRKRIPGKVVYSKHV